MCSLVRTGTPQCHYYYNTCAHVTQKVILDMLVKGKSTGILKPMKVFCLYSRRNHANTVGNHMLNSHPQCIITHTHIIYTWIHGDKNTHGLA